MKPKFYTLIITCLLSLNAFSQVRPDIYSFSSAQRSELADLIIDSLIPTYFRCIVIIQPL